MLTYGSLRAMREQPDRRPRAARRIALAARAEQRHERQSPRPRVGRRR
jgi:hypothetical protein